MPTILDAVNGVTSNTFSSTGTSALKLPVGTTAQRPVTPVVGMIRYNSTTSLVEVYNGTAWG